MTDRYALHTAASKTALYQKPLSPSSKEVPKFNTGDDRTAKHPCISRLVRRSHQKPPSPSSADVPTLKQETNSGQNTPAARRLEVNTQVRERERKRSSLL